MKRIIYVITSVILILALSFVTYYVIRPSRKANEWLNADLWHAKELIPSIQELSDILMDIRTSDKEAEIINYVIYKRRIGDLRSLTELNKNDLLGFYKYYHIAPISDLTTLTARLWHSDNPEKCNFIYDLLIKAPQKCSDDDYRELCYVYNHLGLVFGEPSSQKTYSIKAAIKYFTLALEYAKKWGDNKNYILNRTLQLKAYALLEPGDPINEDAITIINRSKDEVLGYKGEDSQSFIASFYHGCGGIYYHYYEIDRNSKYIELAIENYENSIKIKLENKIDSVTNTYQMLAQCLFKRGAIYKNIKDVEYVERIYQITISMLDSKDPDVNDCYFNLVIGYLAFNEFNKAKHYNDIIIERQRNGISTLEYNKIMFLNKKFNN